MAEGSRNWRLYALFSFPLFLGAANLVVNVAGDANTATGGSFNSVALTGDLRGCLNYVNFNPGTHNITFNLSMANSTITTTKILPPIHLFATGNLTLDGTNGGNQITVTNNNNNWGGFFAVQGTVALSNLSIGSAGSPCAARGGAGGTTLSGAFGGAAGGAMGAGAGLFIDQADVTLSNVAFTNCTVTGGNGSFNFAGGGMGGGGGGMFGGNGGDGSFGKQEGAGGGGGMGALGGTGSVDALWNANGGGGGGGIGGAGGSATGTSASGGSGGGGGGGIEAGNGGSGGQSGGSPAIAGSSSGNSVTAFMGGGGGGGGGSTTGMGTAGAAGGGNGGAASAPSGTASGAGGGGGSTGNPGSAAVGLNGGNGNVGGGGGGGGANTGGGAPGNGGTGGIGGGGGGGGSGGAAGAPTVGLGRAGGYGGGGGGGSSGGDAGFGGGGGGAGTPQSGAGRRGGNGGFGGGGGGTVASTNSPAGGFTAGIGGFGGGGGGRNGHASNIASAGGVGAGIGSSGGGGGAAFGGAIFMRAGTLTIAGTCSTSGGNATAGTGASGGGSGTAAGTDFFIVTGGTLNINPPLGNTVSLAGTIADDNPASVPGSATTTPGMGAGIYLTKNGAGTLALTGANTYAAGTTINQGTVQINSNASLGVATTGITFGAAGASALETTASLTTARPIVLASGAAVTFATNANTLTSNGGITGGSASGSFSKTGSGELRLTGTNSYLGSTFINAGTLRADAVNTLSSSSSVNVTGTLNLNNNSQTIASLSGSGTVTMGAGNLTLGADNLSTTFSGNSSGTGTVTKNGSGTFTLNGNNAYTGITTVNGGTLAVNGIHASAIAVNAGTRLQGVGTINNTVTVDGTIHAGNSIGNITITTMNLNSGSTLDLELQGPLNSVYFVNNAGLDGTLNVILNPGVYPVSHTYDFIIGTGAILGTFSTLQFPIGFLGQVNYFPQLTQLVLINVSAIGGGDCTGNSAALIAYLSTLTQIPQLQPVIMNLASYQETCKGPQLSGALESLSPARNSAASTFTNEISFTMRDIMTYRLWTRRIHIGESLETETSAPEPSNLTAMNAPPSRLLSQTGSQRQTPAHMVRGMGALPGVQDFWASGFGTLMSLDAQSQNPSINTTSYGVLAGYDYYACDWILSAVCGYNHNHLVQASDMGSETSDGGVLAAFATYSFPDSCSYLGNAFVQGGLLASAYGFSLIRNVNIPGPTPYHLRMTDDFPVCELMPFVSFGYDYTLSNNYGVLEPFVSLDWAMAYQGTITEKGGDPINMKTMAHNQWLIRSQIGMNYYKSWETLVWNAILQLSGSYVNKTPINAKSVNALVDPLPPPLGGLNYVALTTYDKVLNLGSIGLDLFFKHKSTNVFGSISYSGEFGPLYVANSFQGMLGFFY